jgi:dipeptidyl aminopeptidase/acylaminoacyl peptidase
LAAFLLEPQSIDGLATWNFFDDVLKEGKDFPVLRLPAAVALTSGKVRPLAEERVMNKPITFEAVYAEQRPLSFAGNPVSGLTWLDDGEHFLQIKEGKLLRVHATTGTARPFYDPQRLAQELATLPTIGKEAAQALAQSLAASSGARGRPAGGGMQMNPQRTGALFEHEGDLYFCDLRGGQPVRLTKSPGREELASFSPDGRFVAFVRDNNLFVVDLATQTERKLTTDGAELVSNGKADWVYFEEIFNRNWRAYWWSPDSTRLAFLRFDDTLVKKFTVVNELPTRQLVETTPYPKAGDPNPLVKLGIVAIAGGEPRWADLSDYSETSSLFVNVGWTPDSARAWFYITSRAQTWLDVCTVGRDGGEVKRLFRETTRTWVDDPGPLFFLKDGSFLMTSARTGWNHLYHFDKDGRLIRPLTSGEWEVKTGMFLATSVHLVDEAGGWVYFSATKDSPIADNLYRVKLDGNSLERLTTGPGDHRVSVSPKGNYFLDTWSDHRTPTQVRLYRTDKSLARTLDTNPVYLREEYRTGQYELLQIKTPDGFVLEGSLLKPPTFDPMRKYPVWFMTYAGPHAPTIHDNWGGGRLRDEMLAQMGFLVFRCDPRSASGKGAGSTWTAYRQLGVQELKDIETAIRWLTEQPGVDAARIGMSGHSYGGFMTAYALTHSKLFAAGIAGAPVTDWRNYDSIYTERYMNTPQENPDGYNATSVVKAAKNLHGRLLLLHGLMDDNVHVQNTVQLADALQRANKDFEMMIYPRARHGIFGAHYNRLMVEFMKRTLKPEP